MIHKKINVEEVKTTIVSYCAYLNMGNSYKYIKYLNDKLNKLGIEKKFFLKNQMEIRFYIDLIFNNMTFDIDI